MKLVITAAAEADLRQIGDWIAHDSRANALAFTDDLRDRCKRLVDTPLGFPLLQRFEQAGIRRRAYRGYLILYRIRADTIEVLHIIHGARDYQRLLGPEDEPPS
jgi:toxin ParE1/3/4